MFKKNILILSVFIFALFAINLSKAAYTYEAVSYEEALSKIMIDSKVFIESQNAQILEVIESGHIYPDLGLVKPGTVLAPYQYYGYFKKAVEYEVVEYDAFGNKSTYKLIDDINTINPNSVITVAQFDALAFIIGKMAPSSAIPYVGNGLSSITANSSNWNTPSVVNFIGDTTLATGGYTYEWDFGDGAKDFGQNVSYVYVLPGPYTVKLLVVDKDGKIGTSVKDIVINGNNTCSEDTDLDLVDDCSDACPLVSGDILNDGCPIFEKTTPSTKNTGYECLYYNKKSVIYGHSLCTICPCDTFTDFNTDVRKCDFLVPALISADGKEVYSRGNYFQVKE